MGKGGRGLGRDGGLCARILVVTDAELLSLPVSPYVISWYIHPHSEKVNEKG